MKNDYYKNGFVVERNLLSSWICNEMVCASVDINAETSAVRLASNAHKVRNQAFDLIHLFLTKNAEMITGKVLIPTYCYARIYTKDSYLLPHLDRPACQHSLTVHISSDCIPSDWPIAIQNKQKEIVHVDLQPGDGIFYLGKTQPHWRLPAFNGIWYYQIFFHWVEATQENEEHFWDGGRSIDDRAMVQRQILKDTYKKPL